jgi:cyclohexyl-isocyanide hydratase
MDRRHFWKLFSGWSLAGLSARASAAGEQTPPPAAPVPSKETAEAAHLEAMNRYAALLGGPKVKVAMLVYPGMFLQDLVGPLAVFESLMNKEIHLVWKNLDPVGNEKDPQPLIPVRPTTTFAQCPSDLDVLFVPGGVPGTFTVMEDPEVLRFLADKARTARFVTSVCTGSLILGAAGLLKGYRATSYWSTVDVLKDLGAIPVRERVVIDRNRITGGGVTAGIDFGLTIAALVTSKDYAQAIQLYLEYDPAPPFNAGSPDKAPPLARQFLTDMFAGMVDNARHTAQRAMKRLGG